MNNRILHIGKQTLDLTTPVAMAIINVTPDSFWKGSRLDSESKIENAVQTAVEGGASILDVGGYSSRPGAENVSADEEFARISNALRIIRHRAPQIPVSIDTFRAEVALQTIDTYGPCIINDISAGELDELMLPAVAKLGVPYIAMHMRGTPANMQQMTAYDNVTDEVKSYFTEKCVRFQELGIREVIIDPGFGFAKTTEQNYELLKGLWKLQELGFAILSGISRKSMIYKVTGSGPEEALAGTCALNWESLRQGASILRVHDVREACDIIKMFNIYKSQNG